LSRRRPFRAAHRRQRIAGEDAIDIGKNLTGIGIQRPGERDRGQIRAAASERGRVAVGVLALKAGHDHDVIIGQQFVDLFRRDVCDPCPGMSAVRENAGFRAGQRYRFSAKGIDRHGGQRDGGEFAGGEQGVELALGWLGRSLAREFDQAVGHARHCGNNTDNFAAFLLRREEPPRDIADALRRSNRSAAVLLNDQAHGKAGPG
jgi:hypothetical protein